MSPLIRRIVFIIAAFVLPLQSWAVALVSDCVMTINADTPAHCCKDSLDKSHHSQHGSVHASSTDKQSSDKQTTNECLSGADCHCSALYQQASPLAINTSIKISANEFIEANMHFVAVSHPPLWRPPIAV